MWTLSVSRKAKPLEHVAATPQYASRRGSCMGTNAGHGHPVALSVTAKALLNVLPSCSTNSPASDLSMPSRKTKAACSGLTSAMKEDC